MNSHKQLPKFIIKSFKNENGRVYYYDFDHDLVGSSGPKVLGTEEGYFVESIEKKLNAKVESSFSSLLDRIKKGIHDNQTIELSEKDDEIARKFFSCSMFRNEFSYKCLISNSLFAGLFEKSLLTSFIANSTIDNGSISYVEKSAINIIMNCSEITNISSRNGFSLISCNSMECVYIPFDPNFAIVLVPDNFPEKHRIYTFTDKHDIEYLNWMITLNEYIYNHDFLIGNDKNELEKLREKIKSKKTDLEKLKSEIVLSNL